MCGVRWREGAGADVGGFDFVFSRPGLDADCRYGGMWDCRRHAPGVMSVGVPLARSTGHELRDLTRTGGCPAQRDVATEFI